MFNELTVEEIDNEWEAAGGSADGEVMLSPQMFEQWVASFRDGFLEYRRLLHEMGVTTEDHEVRLFRRRAARRLRPAPAARPFLLLSPSPLSRRAGSASSSRLRAPGLRLRPQACRCVRR